jgi:hypothetical protein
MVGWTELLLREEKEKALPLGESIASMGREGVDPHDVAISEFQVITTFSTAHHNMWYRYPP